MTFIRIDRAHAWRKKAEVMLPLDRADELGVKSYVTRRMTGTSERMRSVILPSGSQ